MQTYIPSYKRPEDITTHETLGGVDSPFDWRVVVNDDAAKQKYTTADNNVPAGRIVVSGVSGYAETRTYIENELADGGWYLKIDDNVERLSAPPEPEYSEHSLPVKDPPEEDETDYKDLYASEVTPERFTNILHETKNRAERLDAHLCGFATTDNPFFRSRKWSPVGFVLGKCCLIDPTPAEYDTDASGMDDYAFTAEHLLLYGRVLVNRYLLPEAPHYAEGGIGTYEDRLPSKIRACSYLMDKYPGLFRYQDKSGCHPKAELRIRYHSIDSIDGWRREMVETHDNLTA